MISVTLRSFPSQSVPWFHDTRILPDHHAATMNHPRLLPSQPVPWFHVNSFTLCFQRRFYGATTPLSQGLSQTLENSGVGNEGSANQRAGWGKSDTTNSMLNPLIPCSTWKLLTSQVSHSLFATCRSTQRKPHGMNSIGNVATSLVFLASPHLPNCCHHVSSTNPYELQPYPLRPNTSHWEKTRREKDAKGFSKLNHIPWFHDFGALFPLEDSKAIAEGPQPHALPALPYGYWLHHFPALAGWFAKSLTI